MKNIPGRYENDPVCGLKVVYFLRLISQDPDNSGRRLDLSSDLPTLRVGCLTHTVSVSDSLGTLDTVPLMATRAMYHLGNYNANTDP